MPTLPLSTTLHMEAPMWSSGEIRLGILQQAWGLAWPTFWQSTRRYGIQASSTPGRLSIFPLLPASRLLLLSTILRLHHRQVTLLLFIIPQTQPSPSRIKMGWSFAAVQATNTEWSTQRFTKQNGNIRSIPAPSTQKDNFGYRSISRKLQKATLRAGCLLKII